MTIISEALRKNLAVTNDRGGTHASEPAPVEQNMTGPSAHAVTPILTSSSQPTLSMAALLARRAGPATEKPESTSIARRLLRSGPLAIVVSLGLVSIGAGFVANMLNREPKREAGYDASLATVGAAPESMSAVEIAPETSPAQAPPAPLPTPIVVRIEVASAAVTNGPAPATASSPEQSAKIEDNPSVEKPPPAEPPRDGPASPAEIRALYTLEGIFWSEDNPAAIVNDRIVEAGAKIEGAVVKEVRRDSVVITRGGRDYVLTN